MPAVADRRAEMACCESASSSGSETRASEVEERVSAARFSTNCPSRTRVITVSLCRCPLLLPRENSFRFVARLATCPAFSWRFFSSSIRGYFAKPVGSRKQPFGYGFQRVPLQQVVVLAMSASDARADFGRGFCEILPAYPSRLSLQIRPAAFSADNRPHYRWPDI